MNIFVAKLDYGVDSDDLRNIFEPYGEVVSSNVITDQYSGKSRGFGFVEMSDQEEARTAIKNLNNADVQGRSIVVKEAEKRERNQSSGSRW
jgi:RNA recognition motif-containing protein